MTVVLEEPTYLMKRVYTPSEKERVRHSAHHEETITDVVRTGDRLFPESLDGRVEKVTEKNIDRVAEALEGRSLKFPYYLHRGEARGFWDTLSDEEKAVLSNSVCGPAEIAVSLEDRGLLTITGITQQDRRRLAFFESLAFFELTDAGRLVHEKHFVIRDSQNNFQHG